MTPSCGCRWLGSGSLEWPEFGQPNSTSYTKTNQQQVFETLIWTVAILEVRKTTGTLVLETGGSVRYVLCF
jgi:hypothetical protein